jgi:predicted O-methyltransferase YrrM
VTIYNDQVSQYVSSLFTNEDAALLKAREDSPKRGLPEINIKPEEGRFLQLLARACGAKKAVEIGTLGGYSGIWIARGLMPGGVLYTLDMEAKHAEVAREHFELAGLGKVIRIRIGDAHGSLVKLTDESPFDFVFIDAEKTGYQDYFDWALTNVRLGGIIAAHNAFRKGSVAYYGEDDENSELMRQFNKRIAENDQVISTIYPAGDGTLIAVKIA